MLVLELHYKMEENILLKHTLHSKYNYVYMNSGERYLLDLTMDKISEGLDPESFFRISRGCIIRREAVKTVLRHLNGRLKLELNVRTPEELFVSRSRVDDFLAWLE